MIHSTRQEVKVQVLAVALIAVLIFLHYLLWLDQEGVRQIQTLRIGIQAQTKQNAELTERNRALAAEIQDLKGGFMTIEERARSDMGMIRRDETYYRLLEKTSPLSTRFLNSAPSEKPNPPPQSPAPAVRPQSPPQPPNPAQPLATDPRIQLPDPTQKPRPDVPPRSPEPIQPAPPAKPASPDRSKTQAAKPAVASQNPARTGRSSVSTGSRAPSKGSAQATRSPARTLKPAPPAKAAINAEKATASTPKPAVVKKTVQPRVQPADPSARVIRTMPNAAASQRRE